ncbi:hypothetical protein [Enterococcus faecium]|uniref:hypothetical protein n=2 Tax=Enterococcus TaxID=1350 RepID=UPI0013B04C28|nr:hypothetical protein [Enterococcus faecium]
MACFKVTDKGRINFYLMGETKYITYVEEEYISVSKAFKLRKEVQKFLKVSGYLNEEERETKNELKKRFFLLSIWMRSNLLDKYILNEKYLIATEIATKILKYFNKITNLREKDLFIKGIYLMLNSSGLDTISRQVLEIDEDDPILEDLSLLLEDIVFIEKVEIKYLMILFYLLPSNFSNYSVITMDLKMQENYLLKHKEIFEYIQLFEKYFRVRLSDKSVFIKVMLYFVLCSYYDMQSYLLEPHIIITHEQTKTFNKIKDLTLEWKKIYPIETSKYNITESLLKRMTLDMDFFLTEHQKKPILLTIVAKNDISHILFREYIIECMNCTKITIDDVLYYSLSDVKCYPRKWRHVIVCEESLISEKGIQNIGSEIISISRYNMKESRSNLLAVLSSGKNSISEVQEVGC